MAANVISIISERSGYCWCDFTGYRNKYYCHLSRFWYNWFGCTGGGSDNVVEDATPQLGGNLMFKQEKLIQAPQMVISN